MNVRTTLNPAASQGVGPIRSHSRESSLSRTGLGRPSALAGLQPTRRTVSASASGTPPPQPQESSRHTLPSHHRPPTSIRHALSSSATRSEPATQHAVSSDASAFGRTARSITSSPSGESLFFPQIDVSLHPVDSLVLSLGLEDDQHVAILREASEQVRTNVPGTLLMLLGHTLKTHEKLNLLVDRVTTLEQSITSMQSNKLDEPGPAFSTAMSEVSWHYFMQPVLNYSTLGEKVKHEVWSSPEKYKLEAIIADPQMRKKYDSCIKTAFGHVKNQFRVKIFESVVGKRAKDVDTFAREMYDQHFMGSAKGDPVPLSVRAHFAFLRVFSHPIATANAQKGRGDRSATNFYPLLQKELDKLIEDLGNDRKAPCWLRWEQEKIEEDRLLFLGDTQGDFQSASVFGSRPVSPVGTLFEPQVSRYEEEDEAMYTSQDEFANTDPSSTYYPSTFGNSSSWAFTQRRDLPFPASASASTSSPSFTGLALPQLPPLDRDMRWDSSSTNGSVQLPPLRHLSQASRTVIPDADRSGMPAPW